jgi:hypothetical protein
MADFSCQLGVLSCLYAWQTAIAGFIGGAAVIYVLLSMLREEKRKAEREMSTARRALALEIRLITGEALSKHKQCAAILGQTGHPALMVEDRARLPIPQVFPTVASRLERFGDDAPELLLFFSRVAKIRDTSERLLHLPNSMDVPTNQVAAFANELMTIACNGAELISHIRSGVASQDSRDRTALEDIRGEAERWMLRRENFAPELVGSQPAEYIGRWGSRLAVDLQRFG